MPSIILRLYYYLTCRKEGFNVLHVTSYFLSTRSFIIQLWRCPHSSLIDETNGPNFRLNWSFFSALRLIRSDAVSPVLRYVPRQRLQIAPAASICIAVAADAPSRRVRVYTHGRPVIISDNSRSDIISVVVQDGR